MEPDPSQIPPSDCRNRWQLRMAQGDQLAFR